MGRSFPQATSHEEALRCVAGSLFLELGASLLCDHWRTPPSWHLRCAWQSPFASVSLDDNLHYVLCDDHLNSPGRVKRLFRNTHSMIFPASPIFLEAMLLGV